MAVEGGCRCGAVRYRLSLDALPRTYVCHCLDCQTWSGSAFSQQALLPEGDLMVEGEVVGFDLAHPSGTRVSQQRVCGRCHTRLWNTNTRRPGIAVLRAGTLDDSDRLRVVAHIWTVRKQAWLAISDDVPSWPEYAPPEALATALSSA